MGTAARKSRRRVGDWGPELEANRFEGLLVQLGREMRLQQTERDDIDQLWLPLEGGEYFGRE